MLDRYSTEEMGILWSRTNQLRLWARVEVAVLIARKELGEIKEEIPDNLEETLTINPDEVERIENEVTGHDVVAFLMHTSPQLPVGLRPWWHHKLTSYDPQDTALSLQLRASLGLLISEIEALLSVIKERALEHKMTPMIGRTHLVHAEPITFGVKLINWWAELKRHRDRLVRLIDTVCIGKLSGATGMYTLSPEVERHVCRSLGLRQAVSTQIIARDRVAEYMSTLALIGGTIEKISIAIRHMQSTEVREVQEAFRKGQRGSSAMPHKRNPIGSENLSGMARVLRGYACMAEENISTWHERTLENSGPERIFVPDASTLLHYMLRRETRITKSLVVNTERMRRNIDITGGLVFSQEVMALFAERSGLPREEAYEVICEIAQNSWDKESDFLNALIQSPDVMRHVTEAELARCFDLGAKLRYVDEIFEIAQKE